MQLPSHVGSTAMAQPRGVPTRRPAGCSAARRALPPSRRRTVSVKAIGFDFGDDNSPAAPPKKSKTGTIGSLASSLLVFGHVLKGAVGEAFLQAMAITQKYQASNKEVLGAYAKFYNLLLTAGYDTWQDYVLDQILLGRDNAFARAVAQGNLEPGAPVLRAVAYDLDVLQELSLPLPQLAEYVADAAPTAGPYWVEAASSVSTKAKRKALPGSSGAQGAVQALQPNRTLQYITAPPTEEELSAWKSTISSREAWSEAAPLLQQYYHQHGFGITSRNATLRWTKGAFEEGPEAGPALEPLSVLAAQRAALDANTQRHCDGQPAQHVLVAGPSGSGKSALLWEYTLAAGRDRGLRLVDVGAAELPNLLDVARGCGRYPRLRFVLAVDHVDLPLRGGLANDLLGGLSGAGPSGWPANTLLYMAASPSSAVSYDALVARFGLVLTTQELAEADFAGVLREAAAQQAGGGTTVPEQEAARAVEWARATYGALSVRAAVQYLRRAPALAGSGQ